MLCKKFPTLRAILFDLDDTLFDESDFVHSGLRAVAEEIAQMAQISPNQVLQFMLAELHVQGRGKIFNTALRYFHLDDDELTVNRLVQLYRQHPAQIDLYPGVSILLQRLRPHFALAIVTDGAPETQRNKVQALGLLNYVDTVIYCWEIPAPKPDPQGYALALKQLNIPTSQTLIVGDHLHDIAVGKMLNTYTARVRTGRFAAVPNPPDKIPDLELRVVTDLLSS